MANNANERQSSGAPGARSILLHYIHHEAADAKNTAGAFEVKVGIEGADLKDSYIPGQTSTCNALRTPRRPYYTGCNN